MSEDDQEDKNVLRPKFGDPKIVTRRIFEDRGCAHEYVWLMPGQRVVICRVCDREVDPFSVLLKLSQEWENCTYRQREKEKLEASVTQLKEDEKRLKSKVRRSAKGSDERAEEFVALATQRLNDATTQDQLGQFRQWQMDFKWLSSEQAGQIQRAETEAVRRVELHRVATKKTRNVVVLAGGKTAEGPK